ncbi:MAG TPA: hypothetical protein VLE95_00550 [Chlamydiales bacterium]|nr:hypothetical protein [Chlamydiales bacterium]
MIFLKSVLFGDEGSYNIFGIRAEFENELPGPPPASLEGAGLISKMTYKCLNSNAFRWITQGYAHVFIHEMSHALTYKLLTNQHSTVHISKSTCAGRTIYPTEFTRCASDWEKTIVHVAGSLGNIAFSSCKLVAATALKNYISWPIALALGSSGVIWISGELLYACVSASKRNRGDFGRIARLGNTHLALAGTALVSQVALGIFAAIKLAS